MNQFQSFDEVFSALRRRALLIIVIAAIGCVASLYYALQQPKLYEATAVIQLENSQIPDRLAGNSVPSTAPHLRLRLIEQRLMSRDNLLAVMDRFDLFADLPEMSLNERIFQLRQAARITQIVNPQQVFQPNNTPSGLMITVRLGDPEKAAAVANDLMQGVIDVSRTRSQTRARGTLNFFETEEARVREEIDSLEDRIAAFKQANSESLPTGVRELRSQLTTLRDSELALESEIISLQNNATRQRLEVLENQIRLLENQKSLIADRIAQTEALLADAPEVERQFNILERQMNQLQEKYGVITRRKAEAEMGQELEDRQQAERFEVLETALVPEHPISGSRKKLALMGGVASLIVGMALAFSLELLSPRIRTAAQMERMLGMQPVVVVPNVRVHRQADQRRFAWLAGIVALIFATPFVLRDIGGRLGELNLLSWISTEAR